METHLLHGERRGAGLARDQARQSRGRCVRRQRYAVVARAGGQDTPGGEMPTLGCVARIQGTPARHVATYSQRSAPLPCTVAPFSQTITACSDSAVAGKASDDLGGELAVLGLVFLAEGRPADEGLQDILRTVDETIL